MCVWGGGGGGGGGREVGGGGAGSFAYLWYVACVLSVLVCLLFL